MTVTESTAPGLGAIAGCPKSGFLDLGNLKS